MKFEHLRWYGMKFAYIWGCCNEYTVLVFLEGNAWGENTLSEIIEEFVCVADSMGGLLVKISIYQPLIMAGQCSSTREL